MEKEVFKYKKSRCKKLKKVYEIEESEFADGYFFGSMISLFIGTISYYFRYELIYALLFLLIVGSFHTFLILYIFKVKAYLKEVD